jgi:hypothetical protein
MKKIMKAFKTFFKRIFKFIDVNIINPITKLVVSLTGRFEKSGKRFENWLSKANTTIYIFISSSINIYNYRSKDSLHLMKVLRKY